VIPSGDYLQRRTTMTDRDLQQHVQNTLDWEPSIDSADIGVSVENGVVTLRGHVRTVKAVAHDMTIRVSDGDTRTDGDIAQAIVFALRWNTTVPEEDVSVSVGDGWVTLKGRVNRGYQRAAAASAVCDLAGVRGVTNAITVEPPVSASGVKSKIEAALKGTTEVDVRRINGAPAYSRCILSGNVHSWFERDEARRAAWAAPGVKEVEDQITVVP